MALTRPVEVLLVEDNPTDAEVVQEALEQGPHPAHVTVASDGREALDLLKASAESPGVLRPDLVLLDWRLPRVSGREVLGAIRADPVLGPLPVVVLSSSTDAADVAEGYARRASCWVSKPIELDDFANTVQAIAAFWFGVATLPN